MTIQQATRKAVNAVLDTFFEVGEPIYRIHCIRVSVEPKTDGGGRQWVHASMEARGYIASSQEVIE